MRLPISVPKAVRYGVVLVVAGSLALTSATKRNHFTVHDKEFYLDPLVQQFIRPGLAINIVSATIGQDGTISVDYKVADPKGVPLDKDGITTPGPITLSFLIASVPKGQEQFQSYITRNVTDAVYGSGRTAVQATADSGGTTQLVATGEYVYTFRNKAPAGFDAAATHRIGIYGNRNLTEFDLGTNYDDATFDFVPAGGKPAPRDIVRTADCNRCHDSLAAHGGSRKSVELCIMCHTPQTTDPETNNTLDFKVFIHKLHDGSGLPSVQAGTPYQIVGFGNAVNDWSTVVFPADVRRCQVCHNPKNGAAQTNAWLTTPTRAACGSCHDNVNFATGKNHSADNIPEVSDTQCAQCHIPQGDLEFDASIQGAHVYPQESAANPGLVFGIQRVDNGGPGQNPTVTFTVKDFAGNGVPMSALTGGSNRLALVLAGPTSDYGDPALGVDTKTPGYVSENPVPKASCSPDGTCTYTFTHAIPATATGTYAVGMEGRRTFTVNPNTLQAQNVNYGATNVVFYFSVDGSSVQPRRTVVNINNCNQCHARLSVHGENRNQPQMCVLCHNPNDTDAALRATTTNAADKAQPPQGINFAMMVHKIHTGETLGEAGLTYTIVGFGGSHNEFNDVRYPAMGPTGATADTAKCYMCHVQTPAATEGILPVGKRNVVDPQGLLNPAPATTSACTACHFAKSAVAHANLNTDPKFGETCDVCHATGAEFDVDKMHAGK
ncbi:MAG TPA: OmcA/MtrC family decaheme c-type cytochrome [Bryobacteraceae bacterium]|nr:OmcA/MtrC family decaheme c-type cytochrome [Bryobacteraceae bacterium]